MIPICLITGFLGTGKTTMLKRIVAENRERKWIYLVNEFSALDVDGAIVSEENPDVFSIPGGSIFCKCLVTEFIRQMAQIQWRHPDAEGVVIEASGMADPRVIADMLAETGLDQYFQLAHIISIVESRSFLRLIHTLPNILHQVEAADLVLLNKCDLYDEAQLAETEQRIREIKAEANVVRCVRGEVEFAVFGGGTLHDDLHGEYAQCRDPRYSAFSTPSADIDKLHLFIAENEDAVYRVKGHIETAEGPVYFDYSKAGFSVTPVSPRKDYGLAWIVSGNGEEGLSADRVCAQILQID